MAKAEYITVPQKPDVRLTLTPEEASFLRDVLGSGVVGAGRRALSDNIYAALMGLGVESVSIGDFSGTIHFRRQ